MVHTHVSQRYQQSTNRRAAWLKFSAFHVCHPNRQTRCLRSVSYPGAWQVPSNSPGFQGDAAWAREELANASQPFLVGTFLWMVLSMVVYFLQIDIIFFNLLYLSTFCHSVPSAIHGILSLYLGIQFCKLLSAWGFQRLFSALQAGQDPCS